MAEFDLPGIGKARMRLTELSRNPIKRGCTSDSVKHDLVEALYAEIREARIAGHSWKRIRAAIVQDLNLNVSPNYVSETFTRIDKMHEEKTGVKALSSNRKGGRKKGGGRKNQEVEADVR